MESVQPKYQLSKVNAYPPILTSNSDNNNTTSNNQCLQPLPIVRQKAIPLKEITDNYHHNQNLTRHVQDHKQDQYLHVRKKSKAIRRMAANSHAFAWEDLVPYHQYRQRQHRGNTTSDGDAVWDEETENAFMDGLREVPRLGRRKLTVKNKPCGRNELIAAYIYKRTGKHRTRKQVSSHIQVLKNLLKNNEEFMSLVSSDDQTTHLDFDDFSPVSDSKTNMTNSNITSTAGTLSQSSGSPNYQTVGHHYNHNVYVSHAAVSHRQALVKPVNFSMWVASTDANSGTRVGCLHTYTQYSSADAAVSPSQFSSSKSWESRFPYVTKLQAESPTSCPILQMNATIATMNTLPSSSSMFCTQVELLTSTDMYPAAKYEFECITRIYSNHKRVWKLASDVDRSPEKVETGFQKILLPFASEFFAAFFTNLVKIKEDRPNSLIADDHQARSLLQDLTVVQELFAVSKNTQDVKKERAAIFLWEFTKAQDGQPGRAVWKDIMMPMPITPTYFLAPIQGQQVRPLKSDPFSQYQPHEMYSATPIDEWHNPYASYETHIEDTHQPSSAHLHYISVDNLPHTPLEMQPRNYGSIQQPAQIDDLPLQYMQSYQQYSGLSFASTATDSSDYLNVWQPYPILSNQNHPNNTEGLETLI